MRNIFFLFLIIIFTSCDHPKKPDFEELSWPKRTVILDNDLGVLTIKLPEEFDTFYKFEDISDHSCGDLKKYRFQKSSFPKLMESGMIRDEADSIFSFTANHNFDSSCDPTENYVFDSIWIKDYIQHMTKFYNPLNKIKFSISKADSINGRKFIILGTENCLNNNLKEKRLEHLKTVELRALTFINNHLLAFDFECAASNCDSFIPKMYKALKTVQIKPN